MPISPHALSVSIADSSPIGRAKWVSAKLQFTTARTIPGLYWENDNHTPWCGIICGHCLPLPERLLLRVIL